MKLRRQVPSETLFNEISTYWAEIADAHATEKQVNFVRNNINLDDLVLDLGCGTGRHAVLLNKAGYRVVGLDISARLLQLAKTKASESDVSLALVRADMRFVPFSDGVFAAVLSLDSSFGYLSAEAEDLKSLTEVLRVLSGKGVFLLDVFNRERMWQRYGRKPGFSLQNLLFGLLPRVPRFACLFKWRAYPHFYLLQKRKVTDKGETLRDLWVFRDKTTGKIIAAHHVVRLYSFSQLQMMLKKAGFQSLDFQGNYEGHRYIENSGRLISIAHKNS